MNKKLQQGLELCIMAALLIIFGWLLGRDMISWMLWWIAVLLLGICTFPLTRRLCRGFYDQGWILSKTLGIAFSGFLVWFLVNCHILPFTFASCLGVSAVIGILCWGMEIYLLSGEKKVKKYEPCQNISESFSGILEGELLFMFFFLLWTYFAGFKPEAYGTEKFMDYGFMMSMIRSDALPPPDPWFSGEPINYYYGGQYFAVFLTKLTGTHVKETYHLMRTMVASFAFVLPFHVVRQMLLDHGKVKKGLAALGGVLAGLGVSFSGNMHYVMVGKVLPWFRRLFHMAPAEHEYWFPNSTRYIGYYPEGNDKTIHEFPSYSFVLGDLHAHVVNLMFVLTVICLIYAMVKYYRKNNEKRTIIKSILDPYVILFSFFIGLFHWTNFWDFVIYFVMGGMGVIYCNYLSMESLPTRKERLLGTLYRSLIHSVEVLVLGYVFALPFTLQFKTMVSGVALAQNHSRPYQWWLIWGLQFLFTVVLIFFIFKEKDKDQPLPGHSDFYAVILGISAIGLILIPEIVYVKDIYEEGYARSNTMFKLTYQAYTMFALVLGYGLIRMWYGSRNILKRICTAAAAICFAACCCYGATAVHSWFGDVWKASLYKGLDASAYVEERYPEDAGAIRYLEQEVTGSPVILEAHGNSYSDYERVSAVTGLPTVEGWYVHEWLWRGDTNTLDERGQDINWIYTYEDEAYVRSLIEKYQIEYIFVGSMEREKFPELKDSVLQSLGDVVYHDPVSETYIVKTGVN